MKLRAVTVVRIQFKDVVWTVANGDPVDKPAGQNYVTNELLEISMDYIKMALLSIVSVYIPMRILKSLLSY